MNKLIDTHRTEPANGVKLLLDAIDKVRPDMPSEVQDDLTFGALVILHDLGLDRQKRISRLEAVQRVILGLMVGTWVIVFALHGNVPWLAALVAKVFGV